MAQGAKQKILLVEDDVFMIDLLANELQKAGFELEVAKLGSEAIQKFKKWKPDLILLDLMLPDISGFEVLKEIRGMDGGTTKVIVLSNLAEGKDVDEAKRLGAVDYLVKANFTLPEITEKIRSVLK